MSWAIDFIDSPAIYSFLCCENFFRENPKEFASRPQKCLHLSSHTHTQTYRHVCVCVCNIYINIITIYFIILLLCKVISAASASARGEKCVIAILSFLRLIKREARFVQVVSARLTAREKERRGEGKEERAVP